MAYELAAAVYDYMHRDLPYDDWVAYLCSFLPETGSVLDCACGTGQIAIRLAKLGYDVTASDISPQMLQEATKNARRAGARAVFVRQAMQSIALPPRLAGKLDGITCVFDPINHLTGLEQASAFFKSARAALGPGGVLLFDALTTTAFDLYNRVSTVDNDRVTAITYRRAPGADMRAQVEITAFVPQGSKYDRIDFELTYRLHTQEELTELLHKNGFDDVRVYGHMTRMPPKEDEYRLQYVAY